MYLRFWNWV